MTRVGEVAEAFRHGDTALALALEDMRDEVLQLRRFEKDVLLNVGSPDIVQSYEAKWDNTFLHLRYDLARARKYSTRSDEQRMQEVVNSMSVY
jgi:hypothetical protein